MHNRLYVFAFLVLTDLPTIVFNLLIDWLVIIYALVEKDFLQKKKGCIMVLAINYVCCIVTVEI